MNKEYANKFLKKYGISEKVYFEKILSQENYSVNEDEEFDALPINLVDGSMLLIWSDYREYVSITIFDDCKEEYAEAYLTRAQTDKLLKQIKNFNKNI